MQGQFPAETDCKVFEDKTLVPNFSRRDKNVPAFTSEEEWKIEVVAALLALSDGGGACQSEIVPSIQSHQ